MNNIYLSLKKTLRIALPCLALSLFAVSCSNDDSSELPENTTKGKAISFTAVASATPEDYATRIGLDENNLPSSDAAPEPVIWLNGDKFAFNFVKYGEATGQVLEYTASDVSSDGLTCRFTTDQGMNLENGLYRVYVVSPGIATTFANNAVSGTKIDLRGQSQPGVTANYRNLSDYYYQHAYTILEIENNQVVTGSTNLTFTTLTSMLRYQIASIISDPVTVKKVKISHIGTSESQFYTRGSFDPSTGSSIMSTGSPVSALSMLTDQALSSSSAFNAYMTMIPTPGFAGGLNQLSVTVYFYMGGTLYKRVWTWDASLISNNGTFPAGSRYMFNLTLRPGEYESADPAELLDEEELPGDGGGNNPGIGGETIDGEEYQTYTFGNITWMITPVRNIGVEYGAFWYSDPLNTECPGGGWRLPAKDDIDAFFAETAGKDDIISLILLTDATPKTIQSTGNGWWEGPNEYGVTVYMSGQWANPATAEREDAWGASWNSSGPIEVTFYNAWFRQHNGATWRYYNNRYPIRCVKDI